MVKIKSIILTVFFGIFLAACGPSSEELTATAPAAATATQLARPTATEMPTATPVPTATPEPLTEAELGEQLFKTKFLETSGRHCGFCHSIGESESEKVPLSGIATRAGEGVEGLSAEEYIRQSILDPRAYIVEGMNPNGMPTIFGEILSEEDVNHLITYLMTLE